MNKNLFSILAFAAVLLVALYALFTIVNKPTAYAPPTNTYTSNSDLEDLNNTDLKEIDSNLQQLNSEASSI